MRNELVVDMDKAIKKWKPIVEKLGVTNVDRINELCEYAEMHASAITAGMVKENVAYANPGNTAGMGAVAFPGINATPGLMGTAGSGDLGQTLLPASLKIAAQTPGLELLPTINVNSNRVDLLFFDFTYDDVADLNAGLDERASTFKFRPTSDADFTTLTAWLRAEMLANGITELRGRISSPLFFALKGAGLQGGVGNYDSTIAPTGSKLGWVEFKGFSRIDGFIMFRVYVQQNAASTGAWTFSSALNTFGATGNITTILSGATIDSTNTSADQALNAVSSVSLVSLNEDFIDDFTTGRKKAMNRGEWDIDEAGKIGPNSFTKSVQIGVAHVSAALRLSEIGDWKRMYGVDVVEKTKAQLVNQISQKISVEIVERVKEQGLLNRTTAPAAPTAMLAGLVGGGITDGKIFDMSVTATAAALGGEHNTSISRKLWAKVQQASYYVANDGRIGGIDYVVCSGTIAGIFKGIERYTINPLDAKLAGPNQLQPAGTIDGIKIYVDPYMGPADLTIYMGRIGKKEEPGLKFLAYMLAESVEITSEKTMAPRLYMYSRYAVTEFGFFPHKQYFAIKVEDVSGILY